MRMRGCVREARGRRESALSAPPFSLKGKILIEDYPSFLHVWPHPPPPLSHWAFAPGQTRARVRGFSLSAPCVWHNFWLRLRFAAVRAGWGVRELKLAV